MIEIKDHQRKPSAIRQSPLSGIQAFLEQHAVRQAGEGIVMRDEANFGFHFALFGDVLMGRHPTAIG